MRKIMLSLGVVLCLSQLTYAKNDPNVERLLRIAKQRQAEKAKAAKQEELMNNLVEEGEEVPSSVKGAKPSKQEMDAKAAEARKKKAEAKAQKAKYKNMSESEKMDVEIQRIKKRVEEINGNIETFHKTNEMLEKMETRLEGIEDKLK